MLSGNKDVNLLKIIIIIYLMGIYDDGHICYLYLFTSTTSKM